MNKQSVPEQTYWLSEMLQHADSAKRDADLLRDSRKKLQEETAMLQKTQSDLLQVRSQLLKQRSAILRAKEASTVVLEKDEPMGQYAEDKEYDSAVATDLRWLANLAPQELSLAEVDRVVDLKLRLVDLTREQRQVLFDWAGLTRGEQQVLSNIFSNNVAIKAVKGGVVRVDAEAAVAVVAEDADEAFFTAEEATRDHIREFLGRDA